jgi:hypothetical protein
MLSAPAAKFRSALIPSFGGMLMANNRTIELKGEATVSGEIIANQV